MKKLLLLGGTRYLVPVIESAKEMGIYTITCDYLPNNIAHKYSNEYHNVSIVETDKVLALAESLHIDGVMSFACDPGVVPAAYVADKLDLPMPGPFNSVALLQNKGSFRAFLTEHGFNVPKASSFQSTDSVVDKIQDFQFPVIVKPTDSAGSKGVSKVMEREQLDAAIKRALSASRKGEFIIEEFIESKGFSSDSDCFSVDGELKFTSFSSQRFDAAAENPYTPAAYSWPSSMTKEQEQYLSGEIQRLIRLLHMQSSIYNVETRIGTDGKPYIMEVSPRAGGNRLSEMLHYATGTDLVKKSIQAALGEPIDSSFSNELNGYWSEVILHADQAGVYQNVWVSDSIQRNVVETDIWISKNDRVPAFRAANDAIGTLVMRFDEQGEMSHVMDHFSEYVKVIVN